MPKTQNRKPPFALRALAVFGVTIGLLFLLLLGAYALPGGPVRAHLEPSAQTIIQEGLYPSYFGFKLFQMDNYTDTLMLMEAATADETDPLTAMMTNTAYNVDNFETLGEDLARYLEARAAGENAPADLEPFSYARYWHGYMIWLRPLLCLMPYSGVRVVQYLVLFALFAAVLVLVLMRFDQVWGAVLTVVGTVAPVFYGIVLAYILNVFVHFFEDVAFKPLRNVKSKLWKKVRRPLAVALAYLLVALVLVSIIAFIIPGLIESMGILADTVQQTRSCLPSWGWTRWNAV